MTETEKKTKNRYDTIFTTDLDNTVIYSHKHTFHSNKTLVESTDKYTGYMNSNLYNHLCEFNKHIPFIPVTTRTLEQYERIKFPIVPDYALILNGAILLRHGVPVDSWTNTTMNTLSNYTEQINLAMDLITKIGS